MSDIAANIENVQNQESLWDKLSLWLELLEGGPGPEEYSIATQQLLEQRIDELEATVSRNQGHTFAQTSLNA